MTLNATIAIDVNAAKAVTSGLTSAIDQHPLGFSVDVGAFSHANVDFSTLSGGRLLRIGGPSGSSCEIYVLGN